MRLYGSNGGAGLQEDAEEGYLSPLHKNTNERRENMGSDDRNDTEKYHDQSIADLEARIEKLETLVSHQLNVADRHITVFDSAAHLTEDTFIKK